MKKILSMAVALVAFSGVATAADLGVAPVYTVPPVPPSSDWTGLYFGVNGGGAWGDLDWKYVAGGKANQSTSGGLAGATLGFNMQAGRWLWGVEGDFDWADINGSTKCPNPAYSCRSELNSFGTVRARAGWVANRLLLFGTGGLAFGDSRIETKLPGGAPPPSGKPVNGSSNTAVGWTAGVGAEYAFSRRWTGKIEWLYYDLGTDTYKVDFGLKVKAEHTGSIVRVGLNYRFN